MAIEITTSNATGYRQRTIENAAAADVTIAFAKDFTTAGEILTKKSVLSANKFYIPVNLNPLNLSDWSEAFAASKKILSDLNDNPMLAGKEFSLNIAGNGLTSFPPSVSQQEIDLFMARTLLIVQHATEGCIRSVRSGGQTGIDEAGVKAADILGIKSLVNGPADYLLRIRNGKNYFDIKNEVQFKIRFDDDHKHRKHLEPIAEINSQLMICPSEQRYRILTGEAYELTPGNHVELAQNSEGIDRLWVNDDLFSDFINRLHEQHLQEPQYKKILYAWDVDYCEYMADSVKTAEIYAESLEEAEGIARTEFVTDLVHGSYQADIYGIQATKIFIDGNGYEIDQPRLLEDFEGYVKELLTKTPDYVNIWAGTGENADLSNFAIRPFPFRTGENDYENFMSVEQAFQYMKTSPSFSNLSDSERREFREKILATGDGGELKKIGRSIPNFNASAWNRVSHKLMGDMLRASFDYNPEAKERLLSTGNAILSHRQEKSSWRYQFPSILTKVRGEYQRKRQAAEIYDSMTKSSGGQQIKFYDGDIMPEKGVIFVFGSNPEGRHGLGAAKVAKEKFGAHYGQGEGLQGNSYAIPTKDLRVKENKGYRSIPKESIVNSISAMYRCAQENFDKSFMVAYRNPPEKYTLNGYTGKEMIAMFLKAGPIPNNVHFSSEWKDEMTRQISCMNRLKR